MEKILDRIKKMLTLGNDSAATEGERETALRMAYNLLAKHNLSMSDLPSDQQTEAREQEELTISADVYARSLAQAAAKLFFCKYFFARTSTSGKDRHCFVGRQSNVATAKYVAEYLIKSVRKEASKRYKSPTTPEGRSFGVGATQSIRTRVNECWSRTRKAPSGVLWRLSISTRRKRLQMTSGLLSKVRLNW